MSRKSILLCSAVLALSLFVLPSVRGQELRPGTIDRKAVVRRHNPAFSDRNSASVTQVGNGHFAFGFDITGLQTFGSPNANTMSDWGWHEFPAPQGQTAADFQGSEWNTQGRMVPYDIPNPAQKELSDWLVVNPHRLNLGRLGFILKKKDGSSIAPADIQDPLQRLDLWTGITVSTFKIDGKPVKVITIGHPGEDAIAVHVEAPGLNDGQIGVFLEFPYASSKFLGNGADFESPDKHRTIATIGKTSASFHRILDKTAYDAQLSWQDGATLKNTRPHRYELMPADNEQLDFVLRFAQNPISDPVPTFTQTAKSSIAHWAKFWNSGGIIDLSASKDPRWMELERRVVLSQYVLAVNESNSMPPQEAGLVNNGWFGKYHLEMLWWHAAHYALWSRMPLMEKSMEVYPATLASSTARAKRQGYAGARWPKTLGGKEQWEWPGEITPLLIWQQPHPIFFAELEYRQHPTPEILKKWGDVVIQSAEFMAAYPFYDQAQDRYILGYPLQVVSENSDPRTTINPTFELSYWRTGLRLAQKWRERLHLPANPKYADVLTKLSKLPEKNGKYEQWENIDSMWTKYNYEHPALIGAYGMLPGDGVDVATMQRTFDEVNKTWKFDGIWAWDFPMLAMTAAKLGHGDKAIDYLLNYSRFKLDEHGLTETPLIFPYFPGNGGLLYAIAMMTAGWDGAPKRNAPGFPDDGSWVVKWESLQPGL